MDGGENEGEEDGLATAPETPKSQYEHSKYRRHRLWRDITEDSLDTYPQSPLRQDLSDCDNTMSVSSAEDAEMMNTRWHTGRAGVSPENEHDYGDSQTESMERLFMSPELKEEDGGEEEEESDTVERLDPVQPPADEEELQRSLQESVNRYKLLALKPCSPSSPRHPEQEDVAGASPPVLFTDCGYEECLEEVEEDEEELKVSLMESVKRYSMLSRRRSWSCEEPKNETLEAQTPDPDNPLEYVTESKVKLCEEEDSVREMDPEPPVRRRRKGALLREVRCLLDEAVNMPKTLESSERISRRLRSRLNPPRQLGLILENGVAHTGKPGKVRRKRKSRLAGMTLVQLNCHQGKGGSGVDAQDGGGMVARAMMKRRKKCKSTPLSVQKKRAIKLKLALEKKKLLLERRMALEKELFEEETPYPQVDTELHLKDGEEMVTTSEDICMPCLKPEGLTSTLTVPSTLFFVSPCGSSPSKTSFLCAGTAASVPPPLSPAPGFRKTQGRLLEVPGEGIVKLEVLEDTGEREEKVDEEEPPGLEATVVVKEEPVEEKEEEEAQELARSEADVMVAAMAEDDTQRKGPRRRRKRGNKYPVAPKPVRLSRNGKKLGRPRTKNVREHVEEFVRGATSIMEPLNICLPPQLNHHLNFNHHELESDNNDNAIVVEMIKMGDETPDDGTGLFAELDDERRFGCRAAKSNFRCKEIAVRQYDNFTQILLLSTTKQKNALGVQALAELELVLQNARKDPGCHVVLLSAPTGNMFCSGMDLQGLVGTDGHSLGHRVAYQASEALKTFLKTLASFPKPVVAAVNGEAVGLGAMLLPLCDVVYASDKATFRTLYGRIGQAPEGGATCTMPDLLGPARASELLLSGRRLTATEAFEQGLVSQVLWPATFMEQVIPRVQHLATQSVQSAETTKALMRCHQRARVEMAIEMECRLLATQWQSKECQMNMRNIILTNELV